MFSSVTAAFPLTPTKDLTTVRLISIHCEGEKENSCHMNFTFGLYCRRVLVLIPRDSGLRNLHFKKPTDNFGVHAVGDIAVRASKNQIPCFMESKVFVRYTII